MLQRVQTLYLLGALLASIVLYFSPIVVINTDTESLILYSWNILNSEGAIITNTYPLVLLSVIISFLLLFQIVNFKKRIRQLQTGKAIMLLCIVWYILGFIYILNYFNTLDSIQNFSIRLGSVPPILIIILVFIANKYIRKDEDLVRSIDRIR